MRGHRGNGTRETIPARDFVAETRAMRVHGHVTSLRLEAAYWAVLEEMARRRATTVARLVTALRDDALERGCEVANFGSFLRVCCLRHVRAGAGEGTGPAGDAMRVGRRGGGGGRGERPVAP